MEKIAFLVEETGERINCMLNPETLVVQRSAGVQRRRTFNGQVTGAGLSDDPLLFTGGGYTTLELDLLFDLELDPQTTQTSIRRVTERIWQLVENGPAGGRYGAPPLVRFVWGKEWNLLGVVTAVAERFERFTPIGEPRRSWLRMRFVRVSDPDPTPGPGPSAVSAFQTGESSGPTTNLPGEIRELLPGGVPPEIAAITEIENIHIVLGGAPDGENLPQVAYQYYKDPGLWWLIAWFNEVADPLHMEAGTTLFIPSLEILERLRKWITNNSLSSLLP
jgi:hypothetical protein